MAELPADSAATLRLLEGVRAGEPEAFARLFAHHRARLLRLVRLRLDPRLRDRVDPSDVVQETCLEAHRRLTRYLAAPPLPFRRWIRQIAYDRTRKASRRHLAARRTVAREVPLPEGSSLALARLVLGRQATPSEELGRRELAEQVRRALQRLPEADRQILVLRHFEGASNGEVGALLGLEPGAVSKRHGRALLRLHRLLSAGGPP